MLPKFYKCNLGHFVFYKFVVPSTFAFKENKGKINIYRLQPIMMQSHPMNIYIYIYIYIYIIENHGQGGY